MAQSPREPEVLPTLLTSPKASQKGKMNASYAPWAFGTKFDEPEEEDIPHSSRTFTPRPKQMFVLGFLVPPMLLSPGALLLGASFIIL